MDHSNTPWWKFFPRELRTYHPVTSSMKRREPNLVYVFTLPNHPHEPIKLYGLDVLYEEKRKAAKERMSKKAVRDRERKCQQGNHRWQTVRPQRVLSDKAKEKTESPEIILFLITTS